MTVTALTAEIRKISPEKGDLLVFKVPKAVTADTAEMVSKILETLPVRVCAIFLTPDETLSMTLRGMKDEWLKRIGLQRIPE